jgi:hypothetical protein
MIQYLLKLRLKQAQRNLKSVGLLYGIFIIAFYAMVLMKLFKSNTVENLQITAILLVISILSLHFTRSDKRFIFTTFHENAIKIFIAEYNLLVLPISFTLILGPVPYLFFAVHFAISLIAFIEKTTLSISFTGNYLFFTFIPKNMFEWRAGMRKNQYFIILLYLLCLGLGFKFYGSFVILGIITFILSSFYNEAEPRNILLINHKNGNEFLIEKMKDHIKFYLIFIAPILLLYFVKYPKYWIFYIPLLLIYILNFLVFILNKYKSYIPNQLNNSNSAIVGMMFIGMFIPFLFPLSIILVFVYYRKSIKNLNQYFNAEGQ